jgi:hypothetical protein
MSSWRNVSKGRAHRERSQPLYRQQYGLLEKHGDYIKRAKDYHAKQEQIRALRVKAANRNPDEFHPHMQRSLFRDGKHVELPAMMVKKKKGKKGKGGAKAATAAAAAADDFAEDAEEDIKIVVSTRDLPFVAAKQVSAAKVRPSAPSHVHAASLPAADAPFSSRNWRGCSSLCR